MAARDFERVIQLTTEILTNDLMNDEARTLSDAARERMEAAPFIDQFIRKSEQAIAAGNLPAARTSLDKARALDPTHPALSKVAQAIASGEGAAPAADSSSFVVDAPAPAPGAARGTAQAADFGFTFEEEKPAQGGGFGGFSFDTPAAAPADSPFAGGPSDPAPAPTAPAFSFDAPAAAPGPGDFDFSTASIETSADDQKKIEQYLSDGDREFAAGNYQQAIDLWSRIFLIDVTNEAASERIERAKGKRREIEQRLDGVIAAGVQAFERRDWMGARSRFDEVLQADPGNVTAQDYIARIDQGMSGKPAAAPPPVASVLDEEEAQEPEQTMYEEPVAAATPARRKAQGKAAAPGARKAVPVLAIAIAAVLVLGAGGWFVWSRVGKPKVDVAASQAIVTRASTLGQQGKFDEAIGLLRDIKPNDPQYDAALSMIADLQQKKARAATMVDGKPAALFYDENLAAGRAAFDAHDYASAKRGFENALRVKPLPPDAKNFYDTARQEVAKLDTAKTLFVERKYIDVINALEPMLVQDSQNKNIQRMILDAHFNLGAQALQQENLPDAKREFEEVLKADPNDELARRSRDLAERYEGQPRDLLYKIYVKYLPLRQPAV